MKFKPALLIGASIIAVLVLAACGGSSPATPSFTAVEANGVKIVNVVFAKNITKDMVAENPGPVFKPTDTIYILVSIEGRPKSGKITAKYYYQSQYLTEATYDLADINSGVIISIGQVTYTDFYLTHEQALPVSKEYNVELYVDDTKVGDYPFEIAQ